MQRRFVCAGPYWIDSTSSKELTAIPRVGRSELVVSPGHAQASLGNEGADERLLKTIGALESIDDKLVRDEIQFLRSQPKNWPWISYRRC